MSYTHSNQTDNLQHTRSLIPTAIVWGTLTSVINWTKIEALQNIALRIITGVQCALLNNKNQSFTFCKYKHTKG